MASVTLTPADLAPFATIPEDQATAMIEDALAMAVLAAPCLSDGQLDPKYAAAAKAVIRGAILRWHEAGNGALTQRQQTAGPFSQNESYDTRSQRRGMFWPSEIAQLQDICRQAGDVTPNAAFSFRLGGASSPHVPWCNLHFGATYCSCGADLTNYQYPLYEGGALSP